VITRCRLHASQRRGHVKLRRSVREIRESQQRIDAWKKCVLRRDTRKQRSNLLPRPGLREKCVRQMECSGLGRITLVRERSQDRDTLVDCSGRKCGKRTFECANVNRWGQARQELLNRGHGNDTRKFIHHLTVAKSLHGGNPANSKLRREIGILVGIELAELDPSTEGLDFFFEQGTEGPAGTTPRRPEIHENGNGLGTLDDLFLKGRLGNISDDGQGGHACVFSTLAAWPRGHRDPRLSWRALPIFRLTDAPALFPDPKLAEPNGLLAVGGDLSVERLLAAYSSGIFPWYEDGQPLLWWSPDPRMVLVPNELHVPRSLAKVMRKGEFELRLDSAFPDVIRACAERKRPGQRGTWITNEMITAYEALFEQGVAHSAEAWWQGTLVGGLYGVSLGGAFFGESMFATKPDASKFAFVGLVQWLSARGVSIIDCQVTTEHLARFGAREMGRKQFLRQLEAALQVPTLSSPWIVA
jgi:leucyl/phenylalanyl-tRNA---protein transferase